MENSVNNDQLMQELKAAEAILQGHFILSSGRRSATYLQCARLLMDPKRSERVCSALAGLVRNQLPEADIVIAPAMGGLIVGYEVARQLDLPSLFCERVDGEFTLRRGFRIEEGQRVLIVEDVVTTGKSSREAIACVEAHGGTVVGEACLIDRSGGTPDIGVPLVSLMALDIPTYDPNDLPEELKAIEAVKPGSRDLSKKAA